MLGIDFMNAFTTNEKHAHNLKLTFQKTQALVLRVCVEDR